MYTNRTSAVYTKCSYTMECTSGTDVLRIALLLPALGASYYYRPYRTVPAGWNGSSSLSLVRRLLARSLLTD